MAVYLQIQRHHHIIMVRCTSSAEHNNAPEETVYANPLIIESVRRPRRRSCAYDARVATYYAPLQRHRINYGIVEYSRNFGTYEQVPGKTRVPSVFETCIDRPMEMPEKSMEVIIENPDALRRNVNSRTRRNVDSQTYRICALIVICKVSMNCQLEPTLKQ